MSKKKNFGKINGREAMVVGIIRDRFKFCVNVKN